MRPGGFADAVAFCIVREGFRDSMVGCLDMLFSAVAYSVVREE
jgi:hypothetical protein